MHWQDACHTSRDKQAYRITEDGRTIVMRPDGTAFGGMFGHPDVIREFEMSEIGGFNDWKPNVPMTAGRMEE